MKIHKLNLTNFRNHEKMNFNFEGKSCVILGENGTGKTNILEAISMLSTTKSLRAEFDKEVISHNEKFTRLDAEVFPNGDNMFLEMVITKNPRYENATSKKVKLNKVAKSINNFAGTFNTVLFTPHDVEIFTNSPAVRRKHLDSLFFQMDREYKKATTQYTKAIRQRNKILEDIRDLGINADQLDFWTEKLLEAGKVIQTKREEFFNFVTQTIETHGELLNKEKTKYQVVYDKSELSEERLAKYKREEIAAARTLIGPHRDDFYVNFNDYDVAKYGSRGQKRSTVLALKLCEIDFLYKKVGKRPILLLDDIFSELDHNHQEAILNIVDLQQTIITSADKNNKNLSLKVIELA